MENFQETKSETLKYIGKGILISLITTMVFLLIYSVLLTYTNINESTMAPVIIIVTAISILIR